LGLPPRSSGAYAIKTIYSQSHAMLPQAHITKSHIELYFNHSQVYFNFKEHCSVWYNMSGRGLTEILFSVDSLFVTKSIFPVCHSTLSLPSDHA
jgi:hypothetical protein